MTNFDENDYYNFERTNRIFKVVGIGFIIFFSIIAFLIGLTIYNEIF